MIKTDICIIGAGSGGLSVAAGAAQLGMKTVLIERAEMGGDCLNTGCVPSKALLAAAKRAEAHRKSDIKGIKAHAPEIDFAAVKDHVFGAIKTIVPHDSQERFEGLGVTVIRESAAFIDAKTVKAGDQTIRAKYFVIATGSRPMVPDIKGLDKSKVLTNESIFNLREKPEHLLIIGGGPIGIEMAQAHRRLGCQVSVFDRSEILPKDDRENVNILRGILKEDGINIHENVSVNSVEHSANGVTIEIEQNGKKQKISGSHILVAAGRVVNTDSLNLEAAGVEYTARGINVDDHLKTSNRRIFAIGDVAGGPQFTHVAGYHAGVVIRQVCFKMFWAKVDYTALPWVTYCDPELAQVGLTEDAARSKYGDDIKTAAWHFDENDRATAENRRQGRLNVVTDKKGKILGASMIGPHAGELIGLWALAISSGLKIGAITGMIAPYPTFGEISKRAAGAWYTPTLFSNKTRRVVGMLQKIMPF